MENRFSITTFRKIAHSTLVGAFNFVDNETGLYYVEWKLVQPAGKSEMFVSPPSEAWQDKEGKTNYRNYIGVSDRGQNELGRQWMDALTAVAVARYQEEGPAPRSTGAKRPAARTSAPPF